MNEKTLKRAKEETKRFLKRVEAYESADTSYGASKESGAVRRASMDLTRALADLRRVG